MHHCFTFPFALAWLFLLQMTAVAMHKADTIRSSFKTKHTDQN